MGLRPSARCGFLAAAILPLFTACDSVTRITARHDPLYRAEPHASTITATATNQDKKISQVRIDFHVGEMTACPEMGSLPSVIPCRTGTTMQAKICNFPSKPVTATCTLTLQLGDRRLVTYEPSARTGTGLTSNGVAVTYAAGASITQAQVGSGTIPWDLARPIWWQTGFTTGPPAAQDHINVGFFPDPDFPTYRAFTDALQPMLLAAYFDVARPFSQEYSFFLGSFDLWAGPPGADAGAGTGGESCTFDFTGFAAEVTNLTRGQAILHTTQFRDCGNIQLGGTGTVWTGASSPALRYIHESGHFLHGLSDEYCCDGGYFTVATPPNIHASESDCHTTATSIGVATTQCVQVGTTGFWRIDDGTPEIMDDDQNLSSNWRDAAARVVGNRFKACFNGDCY
jgi:hypothetical protein